jgi:hypothetical protein
VAELITETASNMLVNDHDYVNVVFVFVLEIMIDGVHCLCPAKAVHCSR